MKLDRLLKAADIEIESELALKSLPSASSAD